MGCIIVTDNNLKELHEMAWSNTRNDVFIKRFFIENCFVYEGTMDESKVLDVIDRYKCFACVEALKHYDSTFVNKVNCDFCPCDWEIDRGDKVVNIKPQLKWCEQAFSPYAKYTATFEGNKQYRDHWEEKVRTAWIK